MLLKVEGFVPKGGNIRTQRWKVSYFKVEGFVLKGGNIRTLRWKVSYSPKQCVGKRQKIKHNYASLRSQYRQI